MPTTSGKILYVAGLFAVAAALNNPLWTDEKGATKALVSANYTPKTVGGYAWANCGGPDLWRTKFTAINNNGKDISGIVCKGIFRSSTIRFD